MRSFLHRTFAALLALCLAGTDPALAAKRAALVIGNAAYQGAGVLLNPLNDAQLVADALRRANFETVDVKTNLGIAEFRQALRRFQAQADGAEVALLYFAGHGIEAKGANWLIPTDAELNLDRDLEYEAIRLDLALEALAGARMRILILDACRNNPFGRKWQGGSRSVQRGLGPQETDDVLVLFAAAPGQTASDGTGSNSPFAAALAKRLPEPGLVVQLLGGRVAAESIAALAREQNTKKSAAISEGEKRAPSPDKSCSLERRAKSMPGNTPATISFKNSSRGLVHIFWIDHEGERKLYMSLPTGQSHTQKTFMAHPWLVTDDEQRCLGLFMPQASPYEHEVR